MRFNQSCLAVLAANTPSYYCVVFSALAKLLDDVWAAWFKSVVALSSTCLGCSPIDDVSFDAMAKGAEAALLLAWFDAMTCWVRCDDIRLKMASTVMPNMAKIMSNFDCMKFSCYKVIRQNLAVGWMKICILSLQKSCNFHILTFQ